MSNAHQSASRDGRSRSDGAKPIVLHITQPGSEGVANYIIAASAELVRNGYRVEVAGPGRSPLEEGVRLVGLPFHRWHSSRNPADGLLSDIAHLGSIVARLRPAIVHLHSSKAGAAGRLAVKGRVPTVFQPHAWSFDALGWPLATGARRWERFAARWTDGLITVSERERSDAAANGIDTERVATVIPNPVDATRFRPLRPDEVDHDLSDWPSFRRGPVVACLGRLCRQKGQDVLVRAWPLVRAQVPGAQLLLVGDGPLRRRLERQVDQSIHFVGLRSDADRLLRHVQLAVMPSRWEGMSLAMLEAMATGLSVVASDVGGVAETVGRGAGTVVPVGDHFSLAEAIVRRLLSKDLRDREGAAGRRLVLANHTLADSVRQLMKLYEDVVSSPRIPVTGVRADER